ncbi:MAG: Asp-tRNA(Asn)/Glu-tRNA(Gln) amidotransferase subunit GatB [Clostridia bacterium]|nr:Asp-tRNA(Asn)/Glu-tRNA(Gln) amidotransferase subunit GatB [Clostridia bacterium]
MNMIKDYEMVIGLEVHVELKTKTKIFCSCPTTFGAEPNTHVCPVCLGLPGTLPVLNRQVVDYAIKAGLATNCSITEFSKSDRKNYFYPDLPKAYQISQYDLPLCQHGHLDIETEKGSKRIGITRIHIEEDAGKLVHDDEYGTMLDANRCGVPLIEIVSEPDIRSAEEAVAYLKKLRAVILYTGVSDCKMQEGSMRADVNLSVRKKGTEKFGTRTEMKNLNSFTFIAKAIEYEYKRQVEAIESGEEIVQETRRFDQASGKTFSMRKKEDANDYRYFPDPDLAPIISPYQHILELKAQIPELPDARKAKYMEKYGLTAYDAEMIVEDMDISDYFERAVKNTSYSKILANLLIGDCFSITTAEEPEIKISPEALAKIAEMTGAGDINSSTGKKLIKTLWGKDIDPALYVTENNLGQINDKTLLKSYFDKAVESNPKVVSDYKAGKKAAIKSIQGMVMRETGGRANPQLLNEITEEFTASLI